MAGAEHRAPRIPLARVVAAGLILGAGGFGVLRATNAEPLPVPPPISVAEPRPDPNAPILPTLDSFPLPVPAVPSAPATEPKLPAPLTVEPLPTPALPMSALPTPSLPEALPSSPALPTPVLTTPELPPVVSAPPKPAEIAQPAPPAVAPVPMSPFKPANPEKTLRPAPMPLTFLPVEAPTVPPVPEATPAPRKIGDEAVPPPKPVVDRLPPPRPVTIPPARAIDPPQVLTPTPPAPGDDPMLSIKKISLSTTLGAALALAPAAAIKAEEPKANADVKAVEDALKKEIKELKDELKKSKDLMSSLDEQVMGRKDGKVMVPADAGLMARMDKLEKAIKSIDAKLVTLDETLAKRTVGSSPTEPNKTVAGRGTVKVVNEFATKISILVNDKSYPLDPSQSKEIEVPTGGFSYMLLADGSVKTDSTIKDGETVTLRIR